MHVFKRTFFSEERFIVMHATAKMPGNCWGTYRRIAIVEIVPGAPMPRMISARARGVIRVVQTWERLHTGIHAPTGACAFSQAWKEATQLCDKMNHDANCYGKGA